MSDPAITERDKCPECGYPSDQQPGHRLDCPTIKRVPPRMRLLPENGRTEADHGA